MPGTTPHCLVSTEGNVGTSSSICLGRKSVAVRTAVINIVTTDLESIWISKGSYFESKVSSRGISYIYMQCIGNLNVLCSQFKNQLIVMGHLCGRPV